jgi:hypothetical protein
LNRRGNTEAQEKNRQLYWFETTPGRAPNHVAMEFLNAKAQTKHASGSAYKCSSRPFPQTNQDLVWAFVQEIAVGFSIVDT